MPSENSRRKVRVLLILSGIVSQAVEQFRREAHLLARLAHDIRQSADARLVALHDEIAAFPVPASKTPPGSDPVREGRIAVPLRLRGDAGPLAFLGTTTVFGTATDVTLSEVTIEAFFPADDKTARAMMHKSRG